MLNSIPFVDEAKALAPWAGTERASIRREAHRLALELRGRLRYAESEDAKRLLELNQANALLLSGGKILVLKEIADNALKLLRAIIHEEIEAIMQIMAREDEYKYKAIQRLILRYFPPRKNEDPDLYLNHIIAKAFELLILTKQNLVRESELTSEEKHFLRAIRPIIMANKHNYFTGEFWDWNIRETKIRVALANGQRFYQVASGDKPTRQGVPEKREKPVRSSPAALIKLIYMYYRDRRFTIEEIAKREALSENVVRSNISGFVRAGILMKDGAWKKATIEIVKDLDESILTEMINELIGLGDHPNGQQVKNTVEEILRVHNIEVLPGSKIGAGVFTPLDKSITIIHRGQTGPLNKKRNEYVNVLTEKLLKSIENIMSQAGRSFDKTKTPAYVAIAAHTIVRYTRESLESFVRIGLLTEEEVKLISDPNPQLFNTDRLAGQIITILDNYERTDITEKQKKGLLSNLFTVEELELYKTSFPYTLVSRIISLCGRYPTRIREILNIIDTTKEEMKKEAEFNGLPKSLIEEACYRSPERVRRLLRRAMRRAKAVKNIIDETGIDDAPPYNVILKKSLCNPKGLKEFVKAYTKQPVKSESQRRTMPQETAMKVVRKKKSALNKADLAYRNKLEKRIYDSLVKTQAELPDEYLKQCANVTADTLVRYNEASLGSLIMRDILEPNEANSIRDRKFFKTDGLACAIIGMLDGYKEASSLPETPIRISPLTRIKLLGNFYTADEIIALRRMFPDVKLDIIIQRCLKSPQSTVQSLRTVASRIQKKSEKKKSDPRPHAPGSTASETKEPPPGSPAKLIEIIYERFRNRKVTIGELAGELALSADVISRDASGFVKAKLITKKGSGANAVIEVILKDLDAGIVDEMKKKLTPFGTRPRTSDVEHVVREVLKSHEIELEKEHKIGDGTFQPLEDIPIVRERWKGKLKKRSEEYRKKLEERICQSFRKIAQKSSLAFTGKEMEEYSKIAANTLVRYNQASLQSLKQRGILSKDQASSIFDRNIFSANDLARNIISILDNYSIVNITKYNQKKLLANFFTVEELELYKKLFPDIPTSSIFSFCIHYPTDIRDVLSNIFHTKRQMETETEFISDTPKSAIMKACLTCVPSKKDPRELLREAKKISKETGIKYSRLLQVYLYTPGTLKDFLKSHEARKSESQEQVSTAPQGGVRAIIRYKHKGRLNAAEKKYKEVLRKRIYNSLGEIAPDLFEKDRKDYSSIVAHTLVQYDKRSIGSLLYRGILISKEANSIFDKKAFSTRRLAEMIIYIVNGYKKLSIGERSRKRLLAHFYTADEILTLKEAFPKIAKHIVIYVCLHYPNKKIKFLRDMINASDVIHGEEEFEDIPEWITIGAYAQYVGDTRAYLRRFKAGKVKIFGKTYKEIIASRRRGTSRDTKKRDATEVNRGRTSITGGSIWKIIFCNYPAEEVKTKHVELVIARAREKGLNTEKEILTEYIKVIKQSGFVRLPGYWENGKKRIVPISEEEIEAAIDDIHRVAGDILFNDQIKEEIVQKVLGMNLIRDKSVLIVGPGVRDYLPILLAKIGLRVSVIDTEGVDMHRALYARFGLKDEIGAFTSYDTIRSKRFDYIYMLAVIHYAMKSDSEQFTRDLKEMMRPVLACLAPDGGYIFVNTFKDDNEEAERQRPIPAEAQLSCLDQVLGELSGELHISLELQSHIDVNDFCMDPRYFSKETGRLEKRAGIAYKLRKIDRDPSLIAATLAFSNSVTTLKDTAREGEIGYNAQAAGLEEKAASYGKSGQSLILYADDLLENAVIMDLENTVKNILAKHNVLNGGKIVLFARNPANATILERMINRADPGLKTITITEKELKRTKNLNGKETTEIRRVVEKARSKGAKDILVLIKGPAKDEEGRPLPVPIEELASLSKDELKIPVVIIGAQGEGLYSFAEAIARAVGMKGATDADGWLIILEPIRPLSREIQKEYEEYILSLQNLQAA